MSSLADDTLLSIFLQLRLGDLASIGKVNTRFRVLSGRALYLQALAVVNRFVTPVPMIRIMEETDAIISGSAVLRILDDQVFKPRDLDIYVHCNQVDAVATFITNCGYMLVQTRNADETPYGRSFLTEVRRYVLSASSIGGETLEVNLLSTRTKSPLLAVIDFDCTWVMNAITSRGVICLYPNTTLRRTGYVNKFPMSPERLVKYAKRGYFPSHPYNQYLRETAIGLRSLHDRYTLFVAYGVEYDEFWYCPARNRMYKVWFRAGKETIYWALRNLLSTAVRPAFIFDAGNLNGQMSGVFF